MRGLAVMPAVALAAVLLRGRMLRWGASDDELDLVLPGDELIATADLGSTRGISIRAPAAAVWPWVAQLGQGRGGFYSYDFLENLVGCDIHIADAVVPGWQHVEVGSPVHLTPALALSVVSVEPGRSLVLSGGVPVGAAPPPFDFTWSFVLRDAPDGSTRLVVRERYAYKHRWAALILQPTQIISSLMSQKMLRGIRDRAQTV